MGQKNWEELKQIAFNKAKGPYLDKLKFEINEIEKQGATAIWEGYAERKFEKNPNGLILPWLLGIVDADPLANESTIPSLLTVRSSAVKEYIGKYGTTPLGFVKDYDMPDIDIDCLPEARDHTKEYASKKYGEGIDDNYGAVCSVGTWQTYKFKSAIIDAHTATSSNEEDKKRRRSEAIALTKDLPDEVDELKEGGKSSCKGQIKDNDGATSECGFIHNNVKCPKCGSSDTDNPTIGKVLKDFDTLREFATKYPSTINYAIRLIGLIRNMGMHAGALIIADRPLFGNIPLAKSGSKGYWLSMWSEGRNAQLSSLGYVKLDILGLKTLKYIFKCCGHIKENRGILFGPPVENGLSISGWDYNDPENDIAGYYIDSKGTKHFARLNDPDVLDLANKQLTEGVFQFDTPLARQVLSNGVRSFNDLLFFNAAGHPGPLQCCWSHSKINTDKGLIRIDKLDKKQHKILSENNGELFYTDMYLAVNSGKKKLLKIKLKNGKEIIVSPDHKVATNNGYIKASKLSVGQNVAVC